MKWTFFKFSRIKWNWLSQAPPTGKWQTAIESLQTISTPPCHSPHSPSVRVNLPTKKWPSCARKCIETLPQSCPIWQGASTISMYTNVQCSLFPAVQQTFPSPSQSWRVPRGYPGQYHNCTSHGIASPTNSKKTVVWNIQSSCPVFQAAINEDYLANLKDPHVGLVDVSPQTFTTTLLIAMQKLT